MAGKDISIKITDNTFLVDKKIEWANTIRQKWCIVQLKVHRRCGIGGKLLKMEEWKVRHL